MTGLRYTLTGDPRLPAVVFLHGFMGSGADWVDALSTLDGRFYCVAPDLPGHGASLELPPEVYTIEGATRATVGLLAELGVERSVLAGYSMGGRLALYLALCHPERCAGLFLESASPGIEDAAERESRRRSDEETAERLESGDFEGFLRDWYRQPLFAALARNEGLLRKTVEARLRNDPEELARSLRGMGAGSQPSLWGELAGIEVPSLAIVGELDEKYVRLSQRMMALSPRMRAAVVPGAGHMVHAEDPAAYLALLEGFLSSR
ncbi:MAG TPA: 2-succinyl-6-hydroxy-2,4-cyclohexadiene-1-carboxylate synthase [Rubrobacteraceae bacterium]|nr:2-succinyl-6-hydroxy-2,4-cyclohexadiene-1-carboxylate synthase [Rubrobacteraceae bacterium]